MGRWLVSPLPLLFICLICRIGHRCEAGWGYGNNSHPGLMPSRPIGYPAVVSSCACLYSLRVIILFEFYICCLIKSIFYLPACIFRGFFSPSATPISGLLPMSVWKPVPEVARRSLFSSSSGSTLSLFPLGRCYHIPHTSYRCMGYNTGCCLSGGHTFGGRYWKIS